MKMLLTSMQQPIPNDDSCIAKVFGCMDVASCNYNELANTQANCSSFRLTQTEKHTHIMRDAVPLPLNTCIDEESDPNGYLYNGFGYRNNYILTLDESSNTITVDNYDDASCLQYANSFSLSAGETDFGTTSFEFIEDVTLKLTQTEKHTSTMRDAVPFPLNTCIDEDTDPNGHLYNGFGYRNNYILTLDESSNTITVDNYDDASCLQYANSFSLSAGETDFGTTSFEFIEDVTLKLTQIEKYTGTNTMRDAVPFPLNTCIDEGADPNGHLYNGFGYRNNYILTLDESSNTITVDNYDDASCLQYANSFSLSAGETDFEIILFDNEEPGILKLTQIEKYTGTNTMRDAVPLPLNTCIDEESDPNGYLYNGFGYRNNYILTLDESTNTITVDNYDDAGCLQYANSFSLSAGETDFGTTSFEFIEDVTLKLTQTEKHTSTRRDAVPFPLNTCIDEESDPNGHLYNGFGYRNNYILTLDESSNTITVDNYDDASCLQYANSFTLSAGETDFGTTSFEFIEDVTLKLTQTEKHTSTMRDAVPFPLNTCIDEESDPNGYLYNGFGYRNNYILALDESSNTITVDNYDDASCLQYANSFSLSAGETDFGTTSFGCDAD
jgi:hypothetical protein